MSKNHLSGSKANLGTTSSATNGTKLADIFICGTARACAVKNCFKRTTHYHCALCPDRRLVKEQNMVAHQIYHVNGRLENRSIRDNHFIAYTGKCGRATCRFDIANKKHHHCKFCDWPCCGRKLQRCSGHVKTKHPEIFADNLGNSIPSQVFASPQEMPNSFKEPIDDEFNTGHEMFDQKQEDDSVNIVKVEEEEDQSFLSDEIIHVERSDEQENLKSAGWPVSDNHINSFDSPQTGNGAGLSDGDRVKVIKEMPIEDSEMMDDENVLGEFDSGKDDVPKNDNGFLPGGIPTSCGYSHCRERQGHLHCTLCEFITNKKHLLERHQNIHARGFHEKRKQREMYFNGSTGQCGIQECRFRVLKQRHFHCKMCGWACSSRKLQRCIKHISDKHRIEVNTPQKPDKKFLRSNINQQAMSIPSTNRPTMSNAPPSMSNSSNGQPILSNSSYDPVTTSNSSYDPVPMSNNRDIAEKLDVSAASAATVQDDDKDDIADLNDVNEPGTLNDGNVIPSEDDLFVESAAEGPCDVGKCLLQGLHYHCKRCPFVTRQRRSRVRHRAIHLKGYPERRMIRDLHFLIYDGICGRTCRFSQPKRKHFHCKYCDWPCCARKMPRCLNHLRRKHAEVLDEEEECMTQPPETLKRMLMDKAEETAQKNNEKPKKSNEKVAESDAEQQNRVIILEEENTDCPFIIKDVHSLRDSSMTSEESTTATTVNGTRDIYTNNRHPMEADGRMRERLPSVPSYESPFKQYKRPAVVNGPVFVNNQGYPVHHPERPVICRICRAFASERLPLRKMVVYSTSNRLELDLRLTSLLCTYFHVSIEDAFNSYICERDFDDWCNFHAQKISVYPVIAVENGYDATHNHRVVPMEEQYTHY